jgi:site-specific DNA-methyltransferase (adenine-specific)/modification methylase
MLPLLRGIDAVVSDPPYGIGFTHGATRKGLPGFGSASSPIYGDDTPFDPGPVLAAFLKSNGGCGGLAPVVLWGANHYSHRLPPGQWLCWDKACAKGAHSSFQDAEFAWTSRKTPRSIFHHLWLGLLREGEDSSGRSLRYHVSQKPVELMTWCLETTRIGLGKTVLDPYMGSGSTGVACLRTGRKFVGIDIDAENCSNAVARITRIETEIDAALSEPSHEGKP